MTDSNGQDSHEDTRAPTASETAQTKAAAKTKEVEPPRAGTMEMFQAGRHALATVPKLNRFMLTGFIVTFAIFLVMGAIALGIVFNFVIEPLSQSLLVLEKGESFWMQMLYGPAQILLAVAQFVLMVGTLLVALIVTISMMGLWFEAMAERIIRYWRPQALDERPFSYKQWAKGLGRSLLDSIWLILLAILALALGFIPLVGPLLVLSIDSYLLGRELRDPYLTVREATGEDRKLLRKKRALWTAKTGALPALLGLVPVLGWLAMPITLIYLSAGFAWKGEEAIAGGAGPAGITP